MAPVAYDANCLEEVCGSCTMLINGRTRQACSALVDKLLADNPAEIELRPMSKFPVVARSVRRPPPAVPRAGEGACLDSDVDGYYDSGPGPRQSQAQQEQAYPLSECMSCGCCLEACPQYAQIDVPPEPGETDEQLHARGATRCSISRSSVPTRSVKRCTTIRIPPAS